MKKFLQWFIALLQFVIGGLFAAALVLYVLGIVDVHTYLDDLPMQIVVYGLAGLYVVLSLLVMAIVIEVIIVQSRKIRREGGGASKRKSSVIISGQDEPADGEGDTPFSGQSESGNEEKSSGFYAENEAKNADFWEQDTYGNEDAGAADTAQDEPASEDEAPPFDL